MSLKTLLGTAATNATSNADILNKAYDDAIHPTAKNVGQALGTLSSTLNILLAPISWAVYGFEQIDNVVKEKLKDKLSNTPIEDLKEPEPNIVIPAYEALRYSLDKDQLKEMYINLIAYSMQNSTSDKVHPAFVEVVKQLSIFDSELLKKIFGNSTITIPKLKIRLQKGVNDYAGFDSHPIVISPKYYGVPFLDQYTLSLENLERLKIISIEHDNELLKPNIYDDLISLVNVESLRKAYPNNPYVNIIKGHISLTKFGQEFVKSIF